MNLLKALQIRWTQDEKPCYANSVADWDEYDTARLFLRFNYPLINWLFDRYAHALRWRLFCARHWLASIFRQLT
jgi:hypothetical protein